MYLHIRDVCRNKHCHVKLSKLEYKTAGIQVSLWFINRTVCEQNRIWFIVILLWIYIIKGFVGTNTVSVELNGMNV